MKFDKNVTSSRRKNRKAHFTAPSGDRRKRMSATLCRELREKFNFKSLPIRKFDEVQIIRGTHKGTQAAVQSVHRKKYVIYLDKVTKAKVDGYQTEIGIHPSNVKITKLYLDNDRKALLNRKSSQKVDQ